VCRTQQKLKFKSVSQNSEFIVYFNRRGRINDKGQHTWIAANGIDPLQYLAHSATAACYQFLLSSPSSSVDCCLFKSSFLFYYCSHCSPPLVRPLLLLSPPHCAMVFQNKTTVATDCCCCCHCCRLIVAFFLFANMIVAISPVYCHCLVVTILAPPALQCFWCHCCWCCG